MDMSLSKLQELVIDTEAWRAAINWVAKNQLSDWTELKAKRKNLKPLLHVTFKKQNVRERCVPVVLQCFNGKV